MKNRKWLFALVLLAGSLCSFIGISCSRGSSNAATAARSGYHPEGKLDTATFAAGCFWCIEAQFKELKGVDAVISGYTGGYTSSPSYEQVCTGNTGHAEAVNVLFDPSIIAYDELLEAFFLSHDPTQLNRQGNDVGTQYRSAIFYHDDLQQEKAELYVKKLDAEGAYPKKIVTEIKAYGQFYVAEAYHQNYFALNPDQAYCQYVIKPKMDKFRKVFRSKLK